MTQTSWNDCTQDDTARRITPDPARARSLTRTAHARKTFFESLDADGQEKNFVFEAHYTSAVELLHALTLAAGYKVLNHACLGYYLRDALGKERLYRAFDECRRKRNRLVYYGKQLPANTAEKTLATIRSLLDALEKLGKND